jgi:hypothetical protein
MPDFKVDALNPDLKEVEQQFVLRTTDTTAAAIAGLNQVSPVGTITSGTLPNTGAWVSGTAKVNPTTRDITVFVEVVSSGTNAIASCVIALSADNSTFTTVGTTSIAAAINNLGAQTFVVPVRLPNGWFLKLTFANATVAASILA